MIWLALTERLTVLMSEGLNKMCCQAEPVEALRQSFDKLRIFRVTMLWVTQCF